MDRCVASFTSESWILFVPMSDLSLALAATRYRAAFTFLRVPLEKCNETDGRCPPVSASMQVTSVMVFPGDFE